LPSPARIVWKTCTRFRAASSASSAPRSGGRGWPESPWIFWPRFIRETLSKHAILIATIGRLVVIRIAIARDPGARAYIGQAQAPVGDNEEGLDLLTKTTVGTVAVAHVRKTAALTGSGQAA